MTNNRSLQSFPTTKGEFLHIELHPVDLDKGHEVQRVYFRCQGNDTSRLVQGRSPKNIGIRIDWESIFCSKESNLFHDFMAKNGKEE